MSESRTDGLVRDLVRDLEPVRLLPRLRWATAAVVAAWLAAAGGSLLAGVWCPLTGADSHWSDLGFVAVFTGLLVTAGGALLAGLASGVPGRADTVRAGRTAARVGAVLTLAAGLASLVFAAGSAQVPALSHLDCAARACAMGLLPAVLAAAYLGRAAPGRPLLAAGIATLGAVALGAAAIHSGCVLRGGAHWLLGHSLVPVAGAILLALPLAAWVSRRAQRDPSSRR